MPRKLHTSCRFCGRTLNRPYYKPTACLATACLELARLAPYLTPAHYRRLDTASRVDIGLDREWNGPTFQRALSAVIEEIQSNSK